jgi:hypothetical protein
MSLRLCVLAAICAITLPTFAAEANPSRVELTSTRMPALRADVSAVCPALHRQLPEALASAHAQVGKADLVRVEFTLAGRELQAIDASGQHRRYQRWVRLALQEIDCQSDQSAPQRFVLNLRFVDPQDARGAVAMLEEANVASE